MKIRISRNVRLALIPHAGCVCTACLRAGSRGFTFFREFNPHKGGKATCKCEFMPGIKGKTRIEGYDENDVRERLDDVLRVANALGVDEDTVNEIFSKIGMPSLKIPFDADVAISQWRKLETLSSEDWGFKSIPIDEFLSFNGKNFGHEVNGHCAEWGLNMKADGDRDAFKEIIRSIIDSADSVRYGNWRGQDSDVVFFIKGKDVVVTKLNGEFVSILKGGVDNERVKNSRTSI